MDDRSIFAQAFKITGGRYAFSGQAAFNVPRDAVAVLRVYEVRGAHAINNFIRAVAEGLGQHRVDVAEFAILNQIDSRQRTFGNNAVAGLALSQRVFDLLALGDVLLDRNPTSLAGDFQSTDPGIAVKRWFRLSCGS